MRKKIRVPSQKPCGRDTRWSASCDANCLTLVYRARPRNSRLCHETTHHRIDCLSKSAARANEEWRVQDLQESRHVAVLFPAPERHSKQKLQNAASRCYDVRSRCVHGAQRTALTCLPVSTSPRGSTVLRFFARFFLLSSLPLPYLIFPISPNH